MRIASEFFFPCWLIAGSVLTTSGGCGMNARPADVRDQMLASAKTKWQNYPDGNKVVLTHFAYVGRLATVEGSLRVVDARSVMTEMLSPRGVSYLLFFNDRNQFIGQISTSTDRPAQPLWCEGGKLFLHGVTLHEGVEGNVWDFSHGFAKRRLLFEEKVGSYIAESGA